MDLGMVLWAVGILVKLHVLLELRVLSLTATSNIFKKVDLTSEQKVNAKEQESRAVW